MKSSKGYIAASLAVQMIVVPIVVTLGFICLAEFLGDLPRMFPTLKRGSDSLKLTYIILALLGPLLIGGIIGFVFSRMSRGKTASAKARYMTPLIPMAYALVFALLAVAFSKGNYNSVWWGIYLLKNPSFFIVDFVVAFMGLTFVIPVIELSAYWGFLAGILVNEALSKIAIRDERAKSLKIAFSAFLVAILAFAYFGTEGVVNNGIIELKYGQSTIGNELKEFDLERIAPFKENNGLARLEGKSSLEFMSPEEMPRLDGATAAYPIYAAFAQTVYKGLEEPYRNISKDEKDVVTAFVASDKYPFGIIKCSKTSKAYQNLIDGNADIIFVAEPSKNELEAIKAKGDEFVLTPIGSEAFVFFTNISNPVEGLSLKQIQDIYSGGIRKWKEVGGRNQKILPYQRPEDSGSQTVMKNRVMKDIKMLDPTRETSASGMGEIISRVASYKNATNAIGYSFMYYSSEMIKNKLIKYIAVDGVKPTPETVRSKEYPLTVPVYAVTLKSETDKNVKVFIDWILSEEGQSIVEKTGYVPVR